MDRLPFPDSIPWFPGARSQAGRDGTAQGWRSQGMALPAEGTAQGWHSQGTALLPPPAQGAADQGDPRHRTNPAAAPPHAPVTERDKAAPAGGAASPTARPGHRGGRGGGAGPWHRLTPGLREGLRRRCPPAGLGSTAAARSPRPPLPPPHRAVPHVCAGPTHSPGRGQRTEGPEGPERRPPPPPPDAPSPPSPRLRGGGRSPSRPPY